jgi:hypothetical protein
MSAVKKIGVVIAVGVVISVAYYFLKKSKPIIAEEQLADLGSDTVTLIEEELAPVPTIEEQLQIDKCAGLSRSESKICKGGTAPIAGTRGVTLTGTRGSNYNNSSASNSNSTSTNTTSENTSSTNTSSTNTTSSNTTSTTSTQPRSNTSTTPRGNVTGGRRK